MVLIGNSPLCATEETFDCELSLDSGSNFAYVGPQRFSHLLNGEGADTSASAQWLNKPRRKLSTAALKGTGPWDEEQWEGVLDFCRALDCAVDVDHETAMFTDKRVLELGFCTGLPSAFAFRNGAKSIHVHSWMESQLENYVKPTFRRNNIPRCLCKFSVGDCEEFNRSVQNQKFDVVMAPELLCTEEANFSGLHELLECAINPGGIILFSARSHYSECSGSLPAFLDLLKLKGRFDAQIRWDSTRTDFAPRKLVQLTSTIR